MTDRWTEDGRIMLFSVILTMRVRHVISLVKFCQVVKEII